MHKVAGILSVLLLIPMGCNRAPDQAAAPTTEDTPGGGEEAVAQTFRSIPATMRSPEEDRNITLEGPHLGTPVPIAGGEARQCVFVPGGKWLLYSTYEKGKAGGIWAVETAQGENRRRLAEVEQVVFGFQCTDPEAQKVFIEEKLADTEDDAINADSRFWWIDGGVKKNITGPWNPLNIDCTANALSSDGHYVVLTENHTKPVGSGGYSVMHVVNLQTDKLFGGDIDEKWLELCHWRGSGDDLRLMLLTGIGMEPSAQREAFLLDPKTGKCDSGRREEFAELTPNVLVSPDGKTTATMVDRQRLEIRTADSDKVRTLDFNALDIRYVNREHLAWVDNRYLYFQNPFVVLIDTRTMKMNYAASGGVVTFSPDFKFAACKTEAGLAIAPVITEMRP